MLISTVFDKTVTSQILYNNKELFLHLEQNKHLVYSYQNNLWFLFATGYVIGYVFLIYISIISPKDVQKIVRSMVLLVIIDQLIQPVYYLLFL